LIPKISHGGVPFILTALSRRSMITHRFREAERVGQHERDGKRARMSLGLALWILVAPAADWSWTILDGPFDSAVRCEARRESRLDSEYILCARLPVTLHHEASEATAAVSR
jgi:hypothetical protein